MAKKRKSSQYTPTITRAPEFKRKRSYTVPLLWLGAATLIGYPIVRDITAEPMQRGGYADRYSCECDYHDRCSYENGRWYGPWYPETAQDPRDAQANSRCRHSRVYYGSYGGYGATAGNRSDAEYRAPTTERGYRGGFGLTGNTRSVRA